MKSLSIDNKEKILYIHIGIQAILLIVNSLIVNNSQYLIKESYYIFFMLSLINVANFYICILNLKKKLVIESSIVSIISIIYILISSIEIKSWTYNILKTICLFYILMVYTDIFSEKIIKTKKYKVFILIYGLLLFAFNFIDIKYFLTLFQMGYLIMGLLPIIIIINNKSKLKDYGKYGLFFLIILGFILFLFIVSPFYLDLPNISLNNLNEHIILISLEISKLILIFISFYKYIGKGKIHFTYDWIFLILIFTILFYMFIGNFLDSAIMAFMIFLLIKSIVNFNNYRLMKETDIQDLFTDELRFKEYFNKQEDMYAEKTTSFLHDEVLQNIIIAIRKLKDQKEFENKEDIIDVLENTIATIRQEINAYKPNLSKNEKLRDIYYNLIEDIRARFDNEEILIDFNCDESLELYKPYDIKIYKYLNELVVNVFKHSKGYYTEINLRQEKNNILLNVKNIGDYLNMEGKENSKNVGLKILKSDIETLNGEFKMYMSPAQSLKSDESMVSIELIIPIKKEVIYENFVNRRS